MKKIAIIGGGAAGTATLWALSKTQHQVILFDENSSLSRQVQEKKSSKEKVIVIPDKLENLFRYFVTMPWFEWISHLTGQFELNVC